MRWTANVKLDVTEAERGTFAIRIRSFHIFPRTAQEKEANDSHVGIGHFVGVLCSAGYAMHLSNLGQGYRFNSIGGGSLRP
jgi:hypothetical protein